VPIILVCPSCGLRLQVPDELAGRRVSCSGCRAVVTAPAALPPAAVPLPIPVPVPAPPPPPPGPANPFAFDGSGGDPEARDRRRDRDRDDDDDDDYRPARSGGLAGRGRWAPFNTGCGLAKWGAVIEMGGVAYLFLLVELVLLEAAGAVRVSSTFGNMGAFLPVPFFLPILVGTAMMGIGRLRMANVPPQTGAGSVLSSAGIITIVRFVLLLAAAILVMVAISSTRGSSGAKYAAFAAGGMLGGWIVGTLAEITSVAGLAAVGAGMQNRLLYTTAAGSSLIHQILGVVFVFLFLIGYFAGMADILDIDRPRVPGRSGSGRPGLAAALWLLVFVLQIVFTYSQYTLYAAGERAGRSGRDAV
jgi:hypothetical protein